jgi:hypothetical protein
MSNYDGSICLDNDEWDRRFPYSSQAIRRRLRARQSVCKAAEPDQLDSDLDSHHRARSPSRATSSHGSETRQRSGSRGPSPHHDHHGDSDQPSDPEYRHPPVPDDRGEQDEEGPVVPPQAQESVAGIPRLSDDESNNDRELADAEPSVQPSMQSSASQDRAKLQHNIGGRRCCRTDDREDCGPIGDSVTEHGRDDITQLPRKRRRISTSAPASRETMPKRQTLLQCASSRTRQAQRPTTQCPKRGRSQRSPPSPRSSGRSTLEEERVEASVAKFEEWPLDDAVLKRVIVDGVTTF